MDLKHKKIGKLGEVTVEVRSTSQPWREGLDGGAVVLASGLRGSMQGTLAKFWRDNLEGGSGRHVLRQIEENLGRTTWVEPDRPVWMSIQLIVDGKPRTCNVCVATASSDNGAHPTYVSKAISAVVAEAKRHGIKRLSVPLLGAGVAHLDPSTVVQRELEALISQRSRRGEGLEVFTILVQQHDYDTTVKAAEKFVHGTLGESKWYKTIKEQSGFQGIRVIEKLEGGYSGALLHICEVTDSGGAHMPLAVFKIGPTEMIRQEAKGAQLARKLLGDLAVAVDATYELDEKTSALQMPLVSEGDSGRLGMSYLRFFRASGDPREVAEALTQFFAGANRMYESPDIEFHKLSDIREAMDQARKGKYWSEARAGLERLVVNTKSGQQRCGDLINLSYPIEKTIDNPFSETASLIKAWDISVRIPMATTTHGDLNPRNIVMVKKESNGRFVPRVLDFHRFGTRGPLAMDFARLEAGVHVKCLEQQIGNRDLARELPIYSEAVTKQFSIPLGSSLIGSVRAEFTKAVFAVRAIREGYSSFYNNAESRGYWTCLSLCLLSYLRPVYDERLSDEQRLFAIFMAANILDQRVLRES